MKERTNLTVPSGKLISRWIAAAGAHSASRHPFDLLQDRKAHLLLPNG